ncbi:RNI-like superfamily protein [Wolffia australiana]
MAADLADDCLLAIFAKLETSDHNAFGLTCRRWLAIQNAARTSLTLKPCYNHHSSSIYSSYLPRLLARFPQLHSISFSGCPKLPATALRMLKESSQHLRSLAFHYCTDVSDKALCFLFAGCSRLVSVVLYRSSISDRGLEVLASSCPGLLNLNLSHCAAVSDAGVAALCQNCRQLRVLVITSCSGISGHGLADCSSTLESVEAESCPLTVDGLRAAVSGGGLRYLSIAGLRNWAGGSGSLAVIGGGMAAGLRVLNLRLCRFMGDDAAAAIAEGCPRLEEWNLGLCHEIRLGGWSAMAARCLSLKVLHVNRCRNLCDDGLAALQGGCRRLEVLYIQGCPKVTALAMEAFRLARGAVLVKPEESVYIGPCLDALFKVVTRRGTAIAQAHLTSEF